MDAVLFEFDAVAGHCDLGQNIASALQSRQDAFHKSGRDHKRTHAKSPTNPTRGPLHKICSNDCHSGLAQNRADGRDDACHVRRRCVCVGYIFCPKARASFRNHPERYGNHPLIRRRRHAHRLARRQDRSHHFTIPEYTTGFLIFIKSISNKRYVCSSSSIAQGWYYSK